MSMERGERIPTVFLSKQQQPELVAVVVLRTFVLALLVCYRVEDCVLSKE